MFDDLFAALSQYGIDFASSPIGDPQGGPDEVEPESAKPTDDQVRLVEEISADLGKDQVLDFVTAAVKAPFSRGPLYFSLGDVLSTASDERWYLKCYELSIRE